MSMTYFPPRTVGLSHPSAHSTSGPAVGGSEPFLPEGDGSTYVQQGHPNPSGNDYMTWEPTEPNDGGFIAPPAEPQQPHELLQSQHGQVSQESLWAPPQGLDSQRSFASVPSMLDKVSGGKIKKRRRPAKIKQKNQPKPQVSQALPVESRSGRMTYAASLAPGNSLSPSTLHNLAAPFGVPPRDSSIQRTPEHYAWPSDPSVGSYSRTDTLPLAHRGQLAPTSSQAPPSPLQHFLNMYAQSHFIRCQASVSEARGQPLPSGMRDHGRYEWPSDPTNLEPDPSNPEPDSDGEAV